MMRCRRGGLWVALAVVAASSTAIAGEQQGMVEVQGAPPPAPPALQQQSASSPARDASIVAQPFVHDHRLAFSYGTRVMCLDVSTSNFCMGGLQVGFEFKYGDVHAGVIGNALSQPADGSLAPYGGLELGTRYYYVSASHGARPVAVGFAFRGDLDLLGLISFFRAQTDYSYFAVANTYGGNMQVLIGSRFGITARAAVGWSDRVPLDPGSTRSSAGFAVDLALGAIARF